MARLSTQEVRKSLGCFQTLTSSSQLLLPTYGRGAGVDLGLGVTPGLAVGVGLGVAVGVELGVTVGIGVDVGVTVAVGVAEAVAVAVGVGEGVAVGVGVGVGVGPDAVVLVKTLMDRARPLLVTISGNPSPFRSAAPARPVS